VRFGGEGSSGGLIDGDFNYCRDSMIAAITILKAIKKKGTRIFGAVPSYNIARLKLPIDRRKALSAIKKLRKEYPDSEDLDGIKIRPSERSWVLVRPSGTEDAVRISAESGSSKEAGELADSFMGKIKRLAA
jgi:phosphoglucosamine mutase